MLGVPIRSHLPGFSSNYPARWSARLVWATGGIQDRSVVPQLRRALIAAWREMGLILRA